jgi:hypothetical protein
MIFCINILNKPSNQTWIKKVKQFIISNEASSTRHRAVLVLVSSTGIACSASSLVVTTKLIQWPCLDTPAGLELELISNSSSSPKLTLALEVFGWKG